MLIPGPNVALIVANSVSHGVRAGLTTVMGTLMAQALSLVLVTAGMTALLQGIGEWFGWLRWVGAAYLVWLGIQVWRSPPLGEGMAQAAAPRSGASLFRQGLLSAVSNPKAVLFFAAFLPQFIDPARGLFTQFVLMAGTFALVEILTELFIASAANRIRPWLQRTGKAFNRACGGVFVAIGLALPLRG